VFRILGFTAAVAALLLSSTVVRAAGLAPTLPTTVTASTSSSEVVVGTAVTVSGAVVPPGVDAVRTLSLEFRTADGWRRVAGGATDASGMYTLRVPTDWYGPHVLRVRAPATAEADQGVSDTRTVTVTPGYDPQGASTAWRAFDHRPRWDPCRTVPFRTNLGRAPAGGRKLVLSAFRKVHAATGLRFTHTGSTTRVPFADVPVAKQFLSRGLVIAWTTPRKVPQLAGATAGVGGSSSISTNGGPYQYRYGGVSIDATQKLPVKGFGDGQSIGALLLHEIAHTIGLDHTGATSQIMHPQLQDSFRGRYEAGDLSGLRSVGAAQGCF
jgi:hypothetical protein